MATGIIGLGRSGWSLHARTLAAHPGFRVAAVADPLPERREEAAAHLGCAVYGDPAGLLRDPALELVVIATPSHTHVPLGLAALAAGRHVVLEKPMAETTAQVDALIAAAAGAGRVLTCFQPLRLAAGFLTVRSWIESGRLGRPLLVRRSGSSFSRRADWQTLRQMGGGELSNNGPHFIDQALLLLGEGPVEVFAALQRAVSAGDAEDHVKLCLRNGEGLVVDIEISHADAFPPPAWSVLGTAGGLSGGEQEMQVRWLEGSLPPLQAEAGAAPGRRYGAPEELPWRQETLHPLQERSPYALFYDRLRATLRDGAPVFVTAESVRRQIHVIERARAIGGLP